MFKPMLMKSVFALLLAMAIPLTLSSQGNSGIGGVQGDANAAYAIGLWGDLPYSSIQETVGLPNLIADMNSQKLAFTVHDGDLKQGNGAPVCDDALYFRALGWFNSLESPAIFTPGDNDWTDCDRPTTEGTHRWNDSRVSVDSSSAHRIRSDNARFCRKSNRRPSVWASQATKRASKTGGGRMGASRPRR